jgi:hypothetical protein
MLSQTMQLSSLLRQQLQSTASSAGSGNLGQGFASGAASQQLAGKLATMMKLGMPPGASAKETHVTAVYAAAEAAIAEVTAVHAELMGIRSRLQLGASLQFQRTAPNMAQGRAQKLAQTDAAQSQLDSMSEIGETESLRLQMAMDRLSKMMTTLSNVLKKISDTAQSITQNIK